MLLVASTTHPAPTLERLPEGLRQSAASLQGAIAQLLDALRIVDERIVAVADEAEGSWATTEDMPVADADRYNGELDVLLGLYGIESTLYSVGSIAGEMATPGHAPPSRILTAMRDDALDRQRVLLGTRPDAR